jgi:hypothetical protein
VERVVGRTILEWVPVLGTYGMGGPGFGGFLLSRTRHYPKEWLVLILWAADNWLLLDGRWVSAHPRWYGEQRPWQGWGDETWDDFTPIIVGSRIMEAQIKVNESLLYLERADAGARHLLELPRDVTRLSRHGGSGNPHQWHQNESHLDAWVFSRKGDLFC